MDIPLRIGILGASSFAPTGIVKPARSVPGVLVETIASRDPSRARLFAARHSIPRICESYAQLIEDASIDAIYNPLPNSLHAEWSIGALRAGKHVLCEKPLASNAEEAEHMAQAATESGKVLMEAFHYRYHPVATRMKNIIESGAIGAIRHIVAWFRYPLLRPRDIRYSYALAGGAMMDVGCYMANLVRFLVGAEPEVERARARLISSQIDRSMSADLRFPGGCTAHIECSILSLGILGAHVTIVGTAGELRVVNPIRPHVFHAITIRTSKGVIRERVAGETTFTHQLRAFARAIRSGEPPITGSADAVRNMRVIDAIYEKAGLLRRGLTESTSP